jgi:hypothetical protein
MGDDKMEELLKRVEKELDGIAEKGVTSSNLEMTYKLIDIYKDIKEAKYYDRMNYPTNYTNRYEKGRYDRDNYGYMDDRTVRYMNRMRDGMDNYSTGKNRYRDGGSNERMIEGIEMTMCAIVDFIENLMDAAETS